MDDPPPAPELGSTIARTIGIIAKPLHVRLAQAVGLTSTAYLAGQTASSTYLTLPAIMKSPAPLLARQWCIVAGAGNDDDVSIWIRLNGSHVLMVGGILGGAVSAWCATREPTFTTPAFKLFTSSAVCAWLTLPYTLLITAPTASALRKKDDDYRAADPRTTGNSFAPSESESKGTSLTTFASNALAEGNRLDELNTHQLVDRWGWLNLGRAALLAASAGCGAWAVVCEELSIFELLSPM